jgi:hypothetical protein
MWQWIISKLCRCGYDARHILARNAAQIFPGRDARQWRLKEAIALELGKELLVRDGRFAAALGYDSQVVEVFQQFLVVRDWEYNGGAFAAIIGDVFNGAIASQATGVLRCLTDERDAHDQFAEGIAPGAGKNGQGRRSN